MIGGDRVDAKSVILLTPWSDAAQGDRDRCVVLSELLVTGVH